jgi:Raf kinase inhibitor-like YbhB/YbcL family protein
MKLLGIFMTAFCAVFPLKGEAFSLKSASFKANGKIPFKYSCKGEDISPSLMWESPPSGTKSYALIVDDPDAPGWTRIHWVVYNIPGEVHSCEEGQPPEGSTQGVNDQDKVGYRGPCPPIGTHRYFFKLYALKQSLSLQEGATKEQVEKDMENLILGKAELVGEFSFKE